MTKPVHPSPIIFFTLMFLSLSSGMAVKLANGKKTWCVAKPSTDIAALADTLNFVCSITDCSTALTGGACFEPDTYISHASVAMNLYYQTRGRNRWNCYFNNSGIITTTDPSYGNCKYA